MTPNNLPLESRLYATALLSVLGSDLAPGTAIALQGSVPTGVHYCFALHALSTYAVDVHTARGDVAAANAAQMQSDFALSIVQDAGPHEVEHGWRAVTYLQGIGLAVAMKTRAAG